jgi:membrane dipeptidase
MKKLESLDFSPRLNRRAFLKRAVLAGAAALLPDGLSASIAQSGPESIMVDGHLDLGWNIANYGRDYTRSAYAIREDGNSGYAGRAMIGLPELLAGRVALLIGTIYVIPTYHASSSAQIARYSTPDEARYWGWTMLEAIEALAASSEVFTLVSSGSDLDRVLASWAPEQPAEERQIGIILSMEGADPVTHPDELLSWYERGLRGIGLSWGRTQYAGSSSEAGDLTELGVALLNEMKRLGIVLDVAHLSESAFWQAVNVWDDPLVYSHGNSQYYLPTERGLSDAQINVIAEREGLIGIGCYNGFYQQHVTVPGQVTMDDVVNAIDYVCQLTGDCDHAAIGSDADGGFGADDSPLDTVADLQTIPVLLAARGYLPEHIDQITHGNWLRIFRRTLP